MRVLRVLVALGFVAATLAACSGGQERSLPTPSKAFCQAAYEFDTKAPKLAKKVKEQTKLVQTMADHAPKDVAKDAAVYLDAMKRLADGDTSVVDNPKIKTAVTNVERRAINGCALYKQNQDGTGGM